MFEVFGAPVSVEVLSAHLSVTQSKKKGWWDSNLGVCLGTWSRLECRLLVLSNKKPVAHIAETLVLHLIKMTLTSQCCMADKVGSGLLVHGRCRMRTFWTSSVSHSWMSRLFSALNTSSVQCQIGSNISLWNLLLHLQESWKCRSCRVDDLSLATRRVKLAFDIFTGPLDLECRPYRSIGLIESSRQAVKENHVYQKN